jgi:hypothetical protein
LTPFPTAGGLFSLSSKLWSSTSQCRKPRVPLHKRSASPSSLAFAMPFMSAHVVKSAANLGGFWFHPGFIRTSSFLEGQFIVRACDGTYRWPTRRMLLCGGEVRSEYRMCDEERPGTYDNMEEVSLPGSQLAVMLMPSAATALDATRRELPIAVLPCPHRSAGTCSARHNYRALRPSFGSSRCAVPYDLATSAASCSSRLTSVDCASTSTPTMQWWWIGMVAGGVMR